MLVTADAQSRVAIILSVATILDALVESGKLSQESETHGRQLLANMNRTVKRLQSNLKE